MNKKRTPILVKKAKRLFKQGLDYKEISKEMNISTRTLRFWINDTRGISHKNDGIGDNPNEIPLFIRENLAKQEMSNPLDRIKRNVCKVCGKEKEEKWKLTNFCNLNCFSLQI